MSDATPPKSRPARPARRLLRRVARLAARHRSPALDGRAKLAGLEEPVTIRRDRWGLVTIDARTDRDAWFALGAVHAQDRAFQLETIVRGVRGTVSELVGADGLGLDRLSRRLGFPRVAARQLANAPAETRAQLAAYAAGINAAHEAGITGRSLDLALLASKPTEWTATDVQGFLVLLCFALASNWDVELVRWRLLQRHGPDVVAALDPTYRPDLPAHRTAQDLACGPVGHGVAVGLSALEQDLATFQALFAPGGGSNAWVLSGTKTATGRPLLAADPHLMPTFPGAFHLATIRTPRWQASGGAFVGVPAVGLGHNGTLAWGLTAAHADNTDLFVETLSADGASVRAGRPGSADGLGWAGCRVRHETIHVRGRLRPVIERCVDTPRGPLVGPVLDGAPHGLSLSATYLSDRPYVGVLGMHRARTEADVHALFEAGRSCSTINLLWASDEGRTGWKLAVDVPDRKLGLGQVPLPGWDPRVGWRRDPVPFADLPGLTNPADGVLVSANHAPVDAAEAGDGPWLGADWLDGYRAQRISEALRARDGWDVSDTLALQADRTSLVWRELRGTVLALRRSAAVAARPDAREALGHLAAWDGVMAPQSVAASIFTGTLARMARRLLEAQGLGPDDVALALGGGVSDLIPTTLLMARRAGHTAKLLREQPEGWFPRGWDSELARALGAAVRELRVRFGDDPRAWAWGAVRPMRLEHPLAQNPALAAVVAPPSLPVGGDATTVLQAAVDWNDPFGPTRSAPVFRLVVDVGCWERSRAVLLGGQSGDPASKHAMDQAPLWLAGDGLPMPWRDVDIVATTRHTLQLTP